MAQGRSRAGRLQLRLPSVGGVECEGAVRALRVVVRDVLVEDVLQMPFVEHDQVIEAPTTERPDHAFGDRVGVRGVHRGEDRVDAEARRLRDEVGPIATVPIANQVTWLACPRASLRAADARPTAQSDSWSR